MKSTLLVACAAFVMAAMAQTPQVVNWHDAAAGAKVQRQLPAAPPQNAVSVAPQSRGELPEFITEPKGQKVDYAYEAAGYYMDYGYLMLGSFTGVTNMVWDADTVYIKDIVTSFKWDSYVKGVRNADGSIDVNLPQTLYAYEYNGLDYIYEANLVQFSYEYVEQEDGTMAVAQHTEVIDDVDVTYAFDPDTNSYTLQLNEGWSVPTGDYTPENMPEYAICFTYLGEEENEDGEVEQKLLFGGFGDAIQKFTRFDETATMVPDGLQAQQCALSSDYDARLVDVWIDEANSKVYVSNLYDYLPDAAIVGDIKDDQVVFKSPQYLGYDLGYLVYFVGGIVADTETLKADMLEEIVLDYDAEHLVMAAHNPDLWTAVSADPNRLYYFQLFPDMVIRLQTQEELSASPLDPEFYSFKEFDMDYGKCTITWYMLPYNVKGAYLDPARMYYTNYVDGELLEFTTEEYPYITEPMVNVPYLYNDSWDIFVYYEYHSVCFYCDPAESIGVQLFYEAEDGSVFASHLITYDVFTGEISSQAQLEADAEVAEVYYTNLQGQRVAQPAAGLYIRTSVLANGQSRSTKVYLRK